MKKIIYYFRFHQQPKVIVAKYSDGSKERVSHMTEFAPEYWEDYYCGEQG